VWPHLAHVLSAKDYVRLFLTGELATDLSDASATALLNVQQRTWCDELLRAVNIPIDRLPPLRSSTEVAGHLTHEAARAMDLPVGLPVMCGAGDQEAQAIGNGIIRSGLLSSTIGTGGQLFTPIDRYRSLSIGSEVAPSHVLPCAARSVALASGNVDGGCSMALAAR